MVLHNPPQEEQSFNHNIKKNTITNSNTMDQMFSSATENSKIIQCDDVATVDSNNSTPSNISINAVNNNNNNNNNYHDACTRQNHEQALSILHQLIRDGKISLPFTNATTRTTTTACSNTPIKHQVDSLTRLSENTIGLSPSLLLLVIFKTVRLLDILHKNQLVHRDVTLENIIVEQEDGVSLNVMLDNLDNSIELFPIEHEVSSSEESSPTIDDDEHAGSKTPLHKLYTFNKQIGTLEYQPPEILSISQRPFVCLKSEVWSLAVCILRALFKKPIIIQPETYSTQLDELFGLEEENTLVNQDDDETETILTCLKEITTNMLRPNVSERWSCKDVMDYICVASTVLSSIPQEWLNQ